MTLVVEAGTSGASASFSNRTVSANRVDQNLAEGTVV